MLLEKSRETCTMNPARERDGNRNEVRYAGVLDRPELLVFDRRDLVKLFLVTLVRRRITADNGGLWRSV